MAIASRQSGLFCSTAVERAPAFSTVIGLWQPSLKPLIQTGAGIVSESLVSAHASQDLSGSLQHRGKCLFADCLQHRGTCLFTNSTQWFSWWRLEVSAFRLAGSTAPTSVTDPAPCNCN